MSATRVHLVRHGEVDNPLGVLYGRLPVHTDVRVVEADSVFEGLDLGPRPAQLAHPQYWRTLVGLDYDEPAGDLLVSAKAIT